MKDAQDRSDSRERRHFTPQQKVAIVKRHLVDGVPISDLCDAHDILPTQFYQWQKQLFENDAIAFERKGRPPGLCARNVGSNSWKPSWPPKMRSSPS